MNQRPSCFGKYDDANDVCADECKDIDACVSTSNTSLRGRNGRELDGVTLLGNQNTKYKYDYDPSVLETFVNKHPDNDYMVTFDAYEFTSLCPKTGQPDFAKLFINYIPNERMVESKSLKLYLFSFRNHGDFHEDCMNIIMKDLIKLIDPKYIEVLGLFTPRGGISIYPFVNYAKPESDYVFYKDSRKFQVIDNIMAGKAAR